MTTLALARLCAETVMEHGLAAANAVVEATEKAKTLVKSGIERVKLLEPVPIKTVPVTKATLVIGGGIGGMNAALDLANQGIKV